MEGRVWAEAVRACECEKLGPGRWTVVFFFSSRRRHTRFDCDWSSDVCSSDLPCPSTCRKVAIPDTLMGTDSHTTMVNGLGVLGWGTGGIEAEAAILGQPAYQIGRASCRERV